MRKFILFFQIILLISGAVYAQRRVVTGTVHDITTILPGATVVEKGVLNNGVVADANGKFRITLRGQSNTLIVRFIGYAAQEVKITSDKPLNIVLQTNANGLDEVSVIAFGTTKRITNTGAVSSIQASEIRTVPTANVQNSLAGRLPGFFSQQSSGQPGRDASDFFIRGINSLNGNNQPLIIVDDIEYTYSQLQQINVNEIESISILKDASTTAPYGIKGANGVLVVTTRRGRSGRPQFNLRVESGVQQPTRVPKFLDSYESALLINEANRNDGTQPSFTQQDLDLFKSGADPYGHPYVNWYDAIFKKRAFQTNANLDISGGTNTVKYFISGGALNQDGLVKDFADPQSLVNTNYYFRRYNFRSNLDLKVNKNLDMRLDITTRFQDVNQPNGSNAVGEIYNFTRLAPFAAPYLNPNGSYAYAFTKFNPDNLPTLNARIATGGYSRNRRTDFNFLYSFTEKLDAITPGLNIMGRIAYASSDQFTKGIYSGGIPSFHYDPSNNTYLINPKKTSAFYVFQTYGLSGSTDISNNNYNAQFFVNYDRTFNSAHHFRGLILATQQSNIDYLGGAVPSKFRGVSARVTYDYLQKYLLDFNMAYNGSDRFNADKRYGYFPAVSLGYNLAQENFFKRKFPTFSLFKLRGSYGIVGTDNGATNGGRYYYIQNYTQGAGYSFGEQSQAAIPGYTEGALANPNAYWERSRKLDIGLDFNLLNDKISGTIDYFYDERYDQLITQRSVPNIIGVGLPTVNIGRTRNQGYDGTISYHSNFGKVQFNTSLVFSYYRNKVLFADEPNQSIPAIAETGKRIGEQFGYVYEGFYTAADINNPAVPKPNTAQPVQAGDLRYKDLDGNGYIDERDRKAIGNPGSPNTTLGLNLQFAYKGFSASILFQGAYGYSFAIVGTGIEPFQSQFQPIHLERWTPATAETALFPRLSAFNNTINSPRTYLSDFWLINARYVRLKTVDLGYQLPPKLLPFRINSARIYFSAYNLFTFSNYRKYQQDPEISNNTAGDAYINQRVGNLGVQLSF